MPRKPLVAALASLVLPGFGQLYNGEVNRAAHARHSGQGAAGLVFSRSERLRWARLGLVLK